MNMTKPWQWQTLTIEHDGLATLLEGAGLLFKIFECDINIYILLWLKKAVKLKNYNGEVIISVSSINEDTVRLY